MHRSSSVSSFGTEEPAIAWADPGLRPASPTYLKATRVFRQALTAAVEAALRVEREPQQALHDFRRRVRDARAVVAACTLALPTADRLELVATLRAVTRATGAMRDRDALPQALAALPVDPELAEARAAFESRLLVERVAQRQPRQRARRLAVAAAKVSALPDRFEQLLPRDLASAVLRAGWQRLAKRARKSVKVAGRDADATVAVHAARKRLRVLAGALTLLTKSGTRAARRAPRLARLASKLGETLDYSRLEEAARRETLSETLPAANELLLALEQRGRGRRRKLLDQARHALARRRWKSRV